MRHSVMHVCVMIMIMMMMICTCTLFHACTMHVMYEYMSCTIVVAVLPACRRLVEVDIACREVSKLKAHSLKSQVSSVSNFNLTSQNIHDMYVHDVRVCIISTTPPTKTNTNKGARARGCAKCYISRHQHKCEVPSAGRPNGINHLP